jgi:hypothetical protein
MHGLCSTNLSREPTRYRRLSEGALRSTLPPGLPQPCVSQYARRCQRSARLAHLRGFGDAPDQKGKTAIFWPADRCRTATKRLCIRFDNHRSLFEPLSVGTLSFHQRGDQTAYLLDLRGPIPSFIEITDGRCHDVNALDLLVVEPGSFYVMDRGYVDFSRLHTLHQAGAYFVIRPKKYLHFLRYVSQPVDPETGLSSDHIGRLGGFYSRKNFPDKLRLVRFYDSVQDRRFCFLTNHLVLPALTICQLYKMRWQVELFFKWIKQHLRIKRF